MVEKADRYLKGEREVKKKKECGDEEDEKRDHGSVFANRYRLRISGNWVQKEGGEVW